MKNKILSFVLGLAVAIGGLFVASKLTGCDCFPVCACSPCNCHK